MNALDASVTLPIPTTDDSPLAEAARARRAVAANDSPFIDERRLCAELGISSVTATKWRASAAGPPFIKVGRLVRYRRTDVEAWLRSRTVGGRSA